MSLGPTSLSKNKIPTVIRSFHDATRLAQRLGAMMDAGDIPTTGTPPTIVVAAGAGISVGVAGNTFTVTNTGVLSLNSLTGAVVLAAGTSISLGIVGNTITINSSGGGGGAYVADEVWLHETGGVFSHIGPSTTTAHRICVEVSGAFPTWTIDCYQIDHDAKGHVTGRSLIDSTEITIPTEDITVLSGCPTVGSSSISFPTKTITVVSVGADGDPCEIPLEDCD